MPLGGTGGTHSQVGGLIGAFLSLHPPRASGESIPSESEGCFVARGEGAGLVFAGQTFNALSLYGL